VGDWARRWEGVKVGKRKFRQQSGTADCGLLTEDDRNIGISIIIRKQEIWLLTSCGIIIFATYNFFHMQQVKEFLETLHTYIGGSQWFVFFLLGTGLFFTIYLKFPQVRYFWHAIKVVKGKFEKKEDVGDASHFQALSTALSGTIGTGNIAGVALAIHLGGPAGLFWMLITAVLGMTTKLVEITISHKYRDILPDGSISGGPMYYMKKRLNIKLKNGKIIKTGFILGVFFAIGTILSSFGTGSLPQINSKPVCLSTFSKSRAF
jgi:Na+/alanine symporter